MRYHHLPLCLPLFALACDSSTTVNHGPESEVDCNAPSAPVNNIAAVAAVRCSGTVPDTANLVHVRSGPQGSVDQNGRDDQWTLAFWDQDAGVRYFGGVAEVDGELRVEMAPNADDLDCDALVPFDTSIMVPDAAARITGNLVFRHSSESAACAGPLEEPEIHSLMMATADEAWYFAYYGSGGAFQRLCGPCDNNIPSQCNACSE